MRTRLLKSSSDPVSETSPRGEVHRSVLLHTSVEVLDIQESDVVVDGTLGGAGHAREIVKKLGTNGSFIGFDVDADAIERAEIALQSEDASVTLINANFRHIKKELEVRGITRIDKALFDLGWSAYQLDAGRGFSFKQDEPLLMTYAKEPGAVTAATIVNEWAEESIADILYGWGDEHYSRRIARAIIERRAEKPFETASELAAVIQGAVPAGYRHGRIHPATKTFQALRIAVNDELGALNEALRSTRALLAPHGRIAVITFHSIEDRLVKRMFADWEQQGHGRRLTKKPFAPTAEEVKDNPRARSAKLRVFETN